MQMILNHDGASTVVNVPSAGRLRVTPDLAGRLRDVAGNLIRAVA